MTAKDIIKQFEGLRLHAYPDPGSGSEPYTIGYGHTKGVKLGMSCTKETADKWLDEDMDDAYSIVDSLVIVPLSDYERDALCSFVFNVGGHNFAQSTMLRLLNSMDYNGAALQFPRWNKASGKVLNGLVKRRKAEQELFLT